MWLRDIQHAGLHLGELELPPGVAVGFLGKNGAGKTALAALLAGVTAPEQGEIGEAPARREWVSFEESQARYERELYLDDTDFLDQLDFGKTGLEILLESGRSEAHVRQVAAELDVVDLLERGCRQFSTGEWRRVELLRAALLEPELLVLDEPLEALDTKRREQMVKLLERLVERGVQLVVFVTHPDDLPLFCAQVGVLLAGRLVHFGSREEVFGSEELRGWFQSERRGPIELPVRPPEPISPLIDAKGLCVRYGEIQQFAPFDWRVEPGQHTRIIGPNGSGKSTLLSLLTGDHPQCYSNRLKVVGFVRGQGESIWDVKRRIGLVSSALQRDYRVPLSALGVVVSGFFDSIGLYEEPLREQWRTAADCLSLLGLGELVERPFSGLSFGQKRLVLVARALVKSPPLLILDEPTQGLDALNAGLVLACMERLMELELTTVLFVSHRASERVPGMLHELEFRPSSEASCRFVVEMRRLEEPRSNNEVRGSAP